MSEPEDYDDDGNISWKAKKANAERFTAACNATQGIPTEALEAGMVAELLGALRDTRSALAGWVYTLWSLYQFAKKLKS